MQLENEGRYLRKLNWLFFLGFQLYNFFDEFEAMLKSKKYHDTDQLPNAGGKYVAGHIRPRQNPRNSILQHIGRKSKYRVMLWICLNIIFLSYSREALCEL